MAHAPHIRGDQLNPSAAVAPRLTFRRTGSSVALVAALTVVALGAASFGLFSLVTSLTGGTGETASLIRAAQASTARLNAQAAVYAAGGSTQPLDNGAGQPAAIEAYGQRWAVLAPAIKPAAARPQASISQKALDAYGARWSALENASWQWRSR